MTVPETKKYKIWYPNEKLIIYHKITKVLSFNFTLSYRYDSDTPEGVIKNELKSNGSLKYNF